LLTLTGAHARAEQKSPKSAEPTTEKKEVSDAGFWAWAEEGHTGTGGWHYYWLGGLRLDSPEQNFTAKLNAAIFVDAGDVNPDAALQTAFPDFEGTKVNLQRARLTAMMNIYDWARARVQLEFADVRDFKDFWIQFTKVPLIHFITLGHMKEPLSLEQWTSGASTTFMERALPVNAFGHGRNIGIRRQSPFLNDRMTWAVGAFLNTESFDRIGRGIDSLSDASGFNLSGRITGIPVYEDGGRKLLHLGLSYSHGFRDENDPDQRIEFATIPESNLKDETLVDTGKLGVDNLNQLNLEFALVSGPLSFQGEYLHVFTDSETEGDPDFSGYYAFVSYFLTGENRIYGKRNAAFIRMIPREKFGFGKGGWGAWELALRYSHINLNDNRIQGGKERNLTLGLNWYLSRKLRFMFNYIRAEVKDRRTTPTVPEGDADIFQMRFQIEF
ncbi:MAG: hypothetical protein JRJ82_03650, partial [Deltaproteobacteria bacterium]|nr:hypothetical protein [Deltaproteobacteria bacterium]